MQENLIKIYQQSFRENRELAALTDYFKQETFSYFEMAKEIAKLHLLFEECGIEKGDKIALIGRNNTRWVIAYLATVTQRHTAMVLEVAAGIDEHVFAHRDVFPEVRIKGRKDPERIGYRLAEQFGKQGPYFFGSMIGRVQPEGDASGFVAHVVHQAMNGFGVECLAGLHIR